MRDFCLHFVCLTSAVMTVGVCGHVHDHGVAFPLVTFPAAIAGHVIAIGLVNPIVCKYNRQLDPGMQTLTAKNYLQRRFAKAEQLSKAAVNLFVAICAILMWVIFAVRKIL